MDGEVTQIRPRQNWDGAKHEVDLEPPTTDLPLVPDDLLKVVRVNAKYARVYMQDAQAGVLCLSRMQSQRLSQELKKARHMCLTKLRHMSHQADRDTGNIAIKDIIIILKLANQFGWLPCTSFQQKNVTVMLQTS